MCKPSFLAVHFSFFPSFGTAPCTGSSKHVYWKVPPTCVGCGWCIVLLIAEVHVQVLARTHAYVLVAIWLCSHIATSPRSSPFLLFQYKYHFQYWEWCAVLFSCLDYLHFISSASAGLLSLVPAQVPSINRKISDFRLNKVQDRPRDSREQNHRHPFQIQVNFILFKTYSIESCVLQPPTLRINCASFLFLNFFVELSLEISVLTNLIFHTKIRGPNNIEIDLIQM